MSKISYFRITIVLSVSLFFGCAPADSSRETPVAESSPVQPETPEYFNLRPEVEKAYG